MAVASWPQEAQELDAAEHSVSEKSSLSEGLLGQLSSPSDRLPAGSSIFAPLCRNLPPSCREPLTARKAACVNDGEFLRYGAGTRAHLPS